MDMRPIHERRFRLYSRLADDAASGRLRDDEIRRAYANQIRPQDIAALAGVELEAVYAAAATNPTPLARFSTD